MAEAPIPPPLKTPARTPKRTPAMSPTQSDFDLIMNYKVKVPGMETKPQNNFVSDHRTESQMKA